MNLNPFAVLGSFVLGVVGTIFFVHINSVTDLALNKGDQSRFLASIIGPTLSTDPSLSINPIVSTTTLPVLMATTTVVYLVSNPTATTTPPKKYQYKFLREVDPCMLNKLGSQGWQIYQIGGNIDYMYGTDDNCKNGKAEDVLDWVLFSSDNTQ